MKKLIAIFLIFVLISSHCFAAQWTAANLVSGAAGNGNVYLNTDFNRHYRPMCADAGWTSKSRTCADVIVFETVGDDPQLTGACTSPIGDIEAMHFTTATNTMGTMFQAWTDPTYNALAFIVVRNDNEQFFRIFLPRSPRTGCNVATEVDEIKSTDLTGTSWGTLTTVIPSTGNVEFGGWLNTQGGNHALVVFNDSNNGTRTSLYKTTDNGDSFNLTAYSFITGSNGNIEGAFLNSYNNDGRVLGIMRNSSQGFLKMVTSSDWGVTWSAVTNTDLGGNNGASGVKVNPRMEVSGGYPNRVTIAYYDRNLSRGVVSSPTLFDNAFKGQYTPYFLISNGEDGNGGMFTIDESLHKYLILFDNNSTPSNGTNWWVGKDIYYPSKLTGNSKVYLNGK